MIVYVRLVLDHMRLDGAAVTRQAIHEAALAGAAERLRPKMMTVSACDTKPCRSKGTFPSSVTCGMATCNVGMVCCNASCAICAPPSEPCSHRLCD